NPVLLRRRRAARRLARLVRLLELPRHRLDKGGGFLFGDAALFDEPSGKLLTDGWMLGDLRRHQRLCVSSLVLLVVTVAAGAGARIDGAQVTGGGSGRDRETPARGRAGPLRAGHVVAEPRAALRGRQDGRQPPLADVRLGNRAGAEPRGALQTTDAAALGHGE